MSHGSSSAILLREAKKHKGVALGIISVFLILIIVPAGFLIRGRRPATHWNLEGMKVSRATQSGTAINVAISPDGHYIAYVVSEGEKESLNVLQLATGSAVQILPPATVHFWGLNFTPDGNYVDFNQSSKNNFFNTYLYEIPVLGGTPRLRIREGVDGTATYSPDGSEMAYLRVGPNNSRLDVLVAKADGSGEKVLATLPYCLYFADPAWSPSGKTIVLSTSGESKKNRNVLRAISVQDGNVREIYSTIDMLGRPRWLPDGSAIMVPVGDRTQNFRGQLWSISFPDGEPRRLTNDLTNYELCCLDVTRDGKVLVDTETTIESNLWIAPEGKAAQARQITSTDVPVLMFSWTPNGKIVYDNAESNLFVTNTEGAGHSTPFPVAQHPSSSPSVCGDGRYVVFVSDGAQNPGVWRMDLDGANAVRLVEEQGAISPKCSQDGKWVMYLRTPSGIPVRVPITGQGSPEGFTEDSVPGTSTYQWPDVALSPDGKQVAYVTWAASSIQGPIPPSASEPLQLKVVRSEGGPAVYQDAWPTTAGNPRWAPSGQGIEYTQTTNGVGNIWERKLAGGPAKQLTNFDTGMIFDFSWSSDGKQLALTRGNVRSDVILVSNFR
jgi:Tol biopolymer transport system component